MIFFVGPLPPPMHGFSFVNAAMLQRFQASCRVAVFNRAPAGPQVLRSRLLQNVGAVGHFVRALGAARGAGSLYLGLSGGLGQLLDLFYIAAAGLAHRPVVIHHHSFAYLRRATWYSRLCFASARQLSHIVLCECMATLLASSYKVRREQIEIVSNAAFLPDAEPAAPQQMERPVTTLRLGFLSNITPEKGIFLFFELGAALAARGIAIEGMVAGPVAPKITARFQQALSDSPWCRHVGPVYGDDKDRFFASIDVLVFPTLYENEAEPVSILEALRAGVPVIANQRGCIAEMIPATSGAVFDDDSRFVASAAARLADWFGEPAAAWAERRACALRAFQALHTEHVRRIDAITRRLTHSAKAPTC